MATTIYENYPVYEDDLVNKAYVDAKVGTGGMTPEQIEKLNDAYSTAHSASSQATTITNCYNTFYNIEYPMLMNETVEIWYKLSTDDPSINWATTTEKVNHVYDIWYQSDNGKTLVYWDTGTEGENRFEWRWQNVPSGLITRLLENSQSIDVINSNITNITKENEGRDIQINKLGEDYDMLSGNVQTYNSDILLLKNDIKTLQNGYDRLQIQTQVMSGYNLLFNSVMLRPNDATTDWVLDSTNKRVYQRYSTMPNKYISISFKYKKKGNTTFNITVSSQNNSFIVINTTQPTNNEWVEYSYTYKSSVTNPIININYSNNNASFAPHGVIDIDAKENSISKGCISFENAENETLITDLIITYNYDETTVGGLSRLRHSWSPNANEVIGETYWFDYTGLTMIDSASNNKMHLDCNSMDFILNKDNKTYNIGVSEVESEKIEAYKQFKIGGLIVKKIDENNIIIY